MKTDNFIKIVTAIGAAAAIGFGLYGARLNANAANSAYYSAIRTQKTVMCRFKAPPQDIVFGKYCLDKRQGDNTLPPSGA